MSEIPQDVWEMADAIHLDAIKAESSVEEVNVIARAILADRQRDQWQDISTAPIGQQVIVWEPIYGWLIANKSAFDHVWRLKTSGNYWADVPAGVEFTHWQPLPAAPKGE